MNKTNYCLNETCHRFFATLANPTRLAIAEFLMENGPKNVAELSKALSQEQSMVSHNLKPLEECAFVFSERQGKTRVYRVNKEVIEPLLQLFTFHANKYCPNGKVCLTAQGMAQYKKQEAEKGLYVNHE